MADALRSVNIFNQQLPHSFRQRRYLRVTCPPPRPRDPWHWPTSPSSPGSCTGASGCQATGHRRLSRCPAVASPAGASAAAPSYLAADGWPLWCLLTACGAAGQLAENHTRWGSLLSAPLVSMLCAVALAAAGVIPVDCTAYDAVWSYVMPMAAALYLLETDVRRLLTEGGPTLAAFLVGALGMAAGAVAGWALLREALGPGGWKLAACLCASYVGGSVNFAAVAAAVKLPAAAIPAAMAADNLCMAGFLAVLMAVPTRVAAVAAAAAGDGKGAVRVVGGMGQAPAAQLPAASASTDAGSAAAAAPPAAPLTAESASLTLAAAAASCAASQLIADALGWQPVRLMIMAGVAAALAAVANWVRGIARPKDARTQEDRLPPVFAGAGRLGTCLMGVFFAVIGASAGSLSCLAACGPLAAFLCVMVAVHWAVMALLGAGLLRLPREALLLGSNANIGGPATAAAMAAAKGWAGQVQTSMLTGSLGYALGTLSGLAVARVAQALG